MPATLIMAAGAAGAAGLSLQFSVLVMLADEMMESSDRGLDSLAIGASY